MAFSFRFGNQIKVIAPTACFALYNLTNDEKLKKWNVMKSACSALEQEKKDSLGEVRKNGSVMIDNEKASNNKSFHGLFPERQLWKSKMAHPALWDANWDDLKPSGDVDQRKIRKEGVTRHIILIRHGQYDETHRVRSSNSFQNFV